MPDQHILNLRRIIIFYGKQGWWQHFLRNQFFCSTPEAALAADKTPAVSAAKRAASSAATSDIRISSTTLAGRRRCLCGVVDFIEMSDVAAAVDTTDVLAADATDVLSAAKAGSGGFCQANNPCASG